MPPNWPTPLVSPSPVLIWALDYPHPEMACLRPITLDLSQKVEKQPPVYILAVGQAGDQLYY